MKESNPCYLWEERQAIAGIILSAKSPTPRFRIKMFLRGSRIYGVEILALLAFIITSRLRFRDKAINCYIGENNALRALMKGDINTAAIAEMTAWFFLLTKSFGIEVCLVRAGSKLNIADRPTRSERPFPIRRRMVRVINNFGNFPESR